MKKPYKRAAFLLGLLCLLAFSGCGQAADQQGDGAYWDEDAAGTQQEDGAYWDEDAAESQQEGGAYRREDAIEAQQRDATTAAGEADDALIVREQIQNPTEAATQGQAEDSAEWIAREQIHSISAGNYAYEQLDAVGKRVYDQMLSAILNYEEKVDLVTTDVEVMKEAYQALNCDYGGLFWVDGYKFTSYQLGDELINLEFSPSYVMDEAEKNVVQGKIDATVDEWLNGISIGDSDYEKAKYVFETLVERVDYVVGSQYNQNIMSVFLYGETVCQGYACATQYLLRQVGIPSLIVSGTANNQAHAWNIVLLDGNYYHMDTTWGNSTYLDTERQEAKYVNYNFLCMTDEEIGETHEVGMGFPLPPCDSMDLNYYVAEGRYFAEWDPDAIGAVLREAWEGDWASVDIKLGDEALYAQVKDYFIDQQKIVEYCPGMEYIYYMEAPDIEVLTVNLMK